MSLADAPCDFTDPENPACPSPKHTCGRVTKPTMCPFADNSYCPNAVDCGGIEAQYVRVHLPGKHRVLDSLDIQVQRHRPKMDTPQDRDGMVCYAVETRAPTSIHKVYTTTKDMEDPMFYSSCYVREAYRNRWMNFPRTFPQGEFVFGDQCLECKSVEAATANLNSGDNQGRRLNRWLPAPRCADCLKDRAHFNFSGASTAYPDAAAQTAGTANNNNNNTVNSSAAEFWSQDGMMHVVIHYHESEDEQFVDSLSESSADSDASDFLHVAAVPAERRSWWTEQDA